MFAGTRVPVRILFDHLVVGDPLDAFLEAHPSVSIAQVVAVLTLARDEVLAALRQSATK